jgi:hypothetical protein
MHRTRLIVSTIALLSLASFAVADAPSRGVAETTPTVCSLTGGACPRPCPNPCASSCSTAEMAQACATNGDVAAR